VATVQNSLQWEEVGVLQEDKLSKAFSQILRSSGEIEQLNVDRVHGK
jgi:RNA:NAD 2'-phosphotransferase (TPT1/KptA family)